MAKYTEFDQRENETLRAYEEADQALRDFRPTAQTVHPGRALKASVLTTEWLDEDERLAAVVEEAEGAWKAAIKANLPNKVHHSTSA